MTPDDTILLAHGGGGSLMHELVRDLFAAELANPLLATLEDAAVFSVRGRVAFTTDSYVVRPLFFRGGDVGRLAVCGTVNDLAMQGARPLALSLAFILEEGLPLSTLRRVVRSVARAAEEAGVAVATGDTKVVERGAADGLFVNTAGVGLVPRGVRLGARRVRPGDVVLVNGPIADHGVAVLSEREGIAFETRTQSDCAPLAGLVAEILAASKRVRCMKDPTRGGLAACLAEIARAAGVTVVLEEAAIPLRDATAGACELLGLDPLVVANEGKVVCLCPEADAAGVLRAMRAHPYGGEAAVIGRVTGKGRGEVLLETAIGATRVVEMPYGENLPRIC